MKAPDTTDTTASGRPRSPFLPPRWVVRLAWIVHRAGYRLTGGRRGPIRTRTVVPAADNRPAIERCTAAAESTAAGAMGKAAKNASPSVETTTPSWLSIAARRISLCASRIPRYSEPSRARCRVEPSISVNMNVTVPVGRARLDGVATRRAMCRLVSQGATKPSMREGDDRFDGERVGRELVVPGHGQCCRTEESTSAS